MQVHVQRELNHSAESVWALLEDFGNMCWAENIGKLEVEGQGPGMIRKIYMGDGPSIDERLDAIDSSKRHLEYSIPVNNPMPVTDYRASVDVTALGDGRCRIDWRSTATPAGMDEQQASEILNGAYNMMADWLDAYLNR